jgi:hypothetical protein
MGLEALRSVTQVRKGHANPGVTFACQRSNGAVR